MTATVSDIMEIMEVLAPAALAESWDNVGLAVGDPAWPVSSVQVALDPTEAVLAAAAKPGRMLVTHHPLIFKPLTCVTPSTPTGRAVAFAIENRLAVFCAHTNLDRADMGTNDILARRLGLADVASFGPEAPQAPGYGLGRTGRLSQPVTLAEFAASVKQALGLSTVRATGDPSTLITAVAVCAGSGAAMAPDFFRTQAQVLVTGDVKYHEAQIIEQNHRTLVDVGHFASEIGVVPALARSLSRECAARGLAVEIFAAEEAEKDPFRFL